MSAVAGGGLADFLADLRVLTYKGMTYEEYLAALPDLTE